MAYNEVIPLAIGFRSCSAGICLGYFGYWGDKTWGHTNKLVNSELVVHDMS